MRSSIVARNYADTLLALAMRHGGQPTAETFERLLGEVAGVVAADARVREFLESPRLSAEARKDALRKAFAGHAPEPFMRFLMVVVEKRRQGSLREIAAAYRDRLDEVTGRVRVRVELAHEAEPALQDEIRRTLEARFRKTVVPTFTVNPALIGGVVIRAGDLVLDGSLRSRAEHLRRRLRATPLPELAPAA